MRRCEGQFVSKLTREVRQHVLRPNRHSAAKTLNALERNGTVLLIKVFRSVSWEFQAVKRNSYYSKLSFCINFCISFFIIPIPPVQTNEQPVTPIFHSEN